MHAGCKQGADKQAQVRVGTDKGGQGESQHRQWPAPLFFLFLFLFLFLFHFLIHFLFAKIPNTDSFLQPQNNRFFMLNSGIKSFDITENYLLRRFC
jgi:hypothetical protein